MSNLIISSNLNEYIRKDLEMSTSKELKDHLTIKLKNMLVDAKGRALKEKKKTILVRHI